jgi:hypothetical protein
VRYLQGLDALKTWAALGGLFLPQPGSVKKRAVSPGRENGKLAPLSNLISHNEIDREYFP